MVPPRQPPACATQVATNRVEDGQMDDLESAVPGALGKHPVQRRPLRVLFLSAEVETFAKTGGLGDVAAALPKALRQRGVDVRVCMPRYSQIPDSHLDPEPVLAQLAVPVGDRQEPVTIRRGWLTDETAHPPSAPPLHMVEGGPGGEVGATAVPVYLIESERYFDRAAIYGHADDGERFLVFCRGALELCRALGWAPDIVHCNDWHTGIVPNWLRTLYADDPFFADTASVFTIHNLAYQGHFDAHFLWLAQLQDFGFLYPGIPDFANVVNLLGRGVLFADAVTTVSERYAREILTPEYGERLDPLLRERHDRLFGIVNGIDEAMLDPRTDPHLAQNFGADTLDARAANKAALQREAGLPVAPDVPLIGMVGRLSGQKGLDILAPALGALLRQQVQLVVLGTGEPYYYQLLQAAEATHAEKMKAFLTFDTPLAQRIYGGADIFLMPSRYEPCGLGQMIAMRYGSAPVVRATGGLADTVQDWIPADGTGNGFRFDAYDPLDLYGALTRALETYKYPDVWRSLQRRGMEVDFSWHTSAAKYLRVYDLALRSKERASVV